MKMRSKILYVLTLIALAFVLLCPNVGTGVSSAFAAEAKYTGVLEDLQKDENFNVDDYPDKATDYSIKVIQIAEGAAGELFVYTYQPCQKTMYLVASEINMSLLKDFKDASDFADLIDTDEDYFVGDGISQEWGDGHGGGGFGGGGGQGISLLSVDENITQTKLYGLTLLSYSGTLCKYKVNDFTVSADKVRYYNFTSIYREWNAKIDGVQTGDQTVNEKAYPVGQLWTVGTFGNNVVYDVSEIEYITVTAQMVGFRRYSEGFKFQGTTSCDAHFLAFSCDHEIDRLISADVSFYTRDYKAVAGQSTKYEKKVAHNRTLYDFEKAGTDSTGWFDGGDYVWDRMSSTAEYVTSLREQGSSITDNEVQTLTQYDWILNFYETEYKCEAGGKDVLLTALIPLGYVWTIVHACTTTGTIVSGVTLMRLEFEYQGTVYNMGVVSDRQTGSENPTGVEVAPIVKFFDDLWKQISDFFTGHSEWWVYLIAVVVILVVGIPLVSFLAPVVGKAIITLLKAICKGLWWLICLPFKGIAVLIKRRKDKGGE